MGEKISKVVIITVAYVEIGTGVVTAHIKNGY